MPNSAPVLKQIAIDILNATGSNITNLSLPSANTEVTHVLSLNLKEIMIKARGNAKLQFTFTALESGTKFVTIPKGTAHILSDLDFAAETLYIQSSLAGETVEILELF